MTGVANIFGGIKDARSRFDANYLIPCHCLWRIDNVKVDENRSGEGFMAIELTCLEDLVPDKYARGVYGHTQGESASHLMMKKHDSFLGNVKSFIANTMGVPVEEITENDALAICDASQPLRNTVVEIEARNTKTKRNTDFTVVNYKGEVTPSELLSRWSEREDGAALVERFFPDGLLERLAAADAAVASPPAPSE